VTRIDLPVSNEGLFTAIGRLAGQDGTVLSLQIPGGFMTTGDLLAELRGSRPDMARVVEAAVQPERAYVVVPTQAVKAWMEREPDTWAKVVEWFGANGKALVQV
jgi:hypothetical protein